MTPDIRQRNISKDSSSKITQISEEAQSLLKKATSLQITWDELPEWSKDNEYIHTSFRPISNSQYLHPSGCDPMGAWWYTFATEHYPQTSQDDFIVFFLLFLGGASCFALSTIYHLLANHSHTTHDLCHKLDLLGIVTVTSGCFPPGLWYTLPCAQRNTKITWIAIDLFAQFLAAIFVLFVKRFRTSAWRPLRGLLFSFMTSSAFYPIIISVLQNGWAKADAEYGASLYALTILIYVSSVFVYASRCPKAWKSGHFDVWGQSHQIFHFGMAIGYTVHCVAFFKGVHQFYGVKGGRCDTWI
ncbi:hemolysin-III related-domain-containing protein [Aspergillus multicolor]|uniref:hemolysin-III related-domain-containing protein n=1 Tax=Aspergillus multicolor TaxID=41759 RepID=UPI003CCD4B57